MENHRVIVPTQPPQLLPRSQIVPGLAYHVRTWDDTAHKVFVNAVDEHSVTIEYEDDGLINQIPIDYFLDELEANLVSRRLPKRTDYFREKSPEAPGEISEARRARILAIAASMPKDEALAG